MKPTELRKQFLIFIIFAGVITAALIILPIIEPFLIRYVTGFFSSTDEQMGMTASKLFDQLLRIVRVILWMALIIAIVRFINSVVFGTALRKSNSYELSSLLRNVISIIIYIVAFFVIFNSQYPRVDLAALFTTSTIIGVVIGLALQDTLGNLFAGIALQADQPFQVGDIIVLSNNKGSGVVESVTWRGVKIRTFQNKLIIISNAILGKEAIEVAPRDNLNARLVFFNTLYTNSPAKTIQVVREAVRQVENVSSKMRPIVRVQNLGDNGIDWEIKYWLDDYTKFNETDALIRQRIWYVFQREKIDFAYPTRTLYIETEKKKEVFEETTNEICERISRAPIFAPLSDEEAKKLARASHVRVFAPNEAIVRKGQESGSMFIVHRGSVKVQITENGVAKTISTLREGDIFGEMGLFTGEPRTANVVSVEETEVLEINNRAIKPLFEDNPDLVAALSQTIAERRIMLAQNNEENKTLSAAEASAGIFDSIRKFFGLS